MSGPPLRVIRLDPPRPVWLSFQPGAWVPTIVREWQLQPDGWWAQIDHAVNGNPTQAVYVQADRLRPRDPIYIGRTHRCSDPP